MQDLTFSACLHHWWWSFTDKKPRQGSWVALLETTELLPWPRAALWLSASGPGLGLFKNLIMDSDFNGVVRNFLLMVTFRTIIPCLSPLLHLCMGLLHTALFSELCKGASLLSAGSPPIPPPPPSSPHLLAPASHQEQEIQEAQKDNYPSNCHHRHTAQEFISHSKEYLAIIPHCTYCNISLPPILSRKWDNCNSHSGWLSLRVQAKERRHSKS